MTAPTFFMLQKNASNAFSVFFVFLILSGQANSSFAVSSVDTWLDFSHASRLKQALPSFERGQSLNDVEDNTLPLSINAPVAATSADRFSSLKPEYFLLNHWLATVPTPDLRQNLPDAISTGLSAAEEKELYLEWLTFLEDFIFYVAASSALGLAEKKQVTVARKTKKRRKKWTVNTLPKTPEPAASTSTDQASATTLSLSPAPASDPVLQPAEETSQKVTGFGFTQEEEAPPPQKVNKKISVAKRINTLRDTLKSLLKQHIETRATVNQHPLIQNFYHEITTAQKDIPDLQQYFYSDNNDGIHYEMLAPGAILLLLKNRFPDEMENAQTSKHALTKARLTYVLLKPEVENLTASFLMPYLKEDPNNEELFHHIVSHFPHEHRQALPRMTLPRSLFSLTEFFSWELKKMQSLQTFLHIDTDMRQTELERLYVIDHHRRHKALVYIRLKADNSVRIMISDSLRSFPEPKESMIVNMVTNIIALSLMTAFEDERINISKALFYYFPEARQKDVMGCLAFLFQDIQVLLKQPLGRGYKAVPAEDLPMAVWTPMIADIASKEMSGFAINTGDPSQMRSPAETTHLENNLRKISREHLNTQTDVAFINSDKYFFKQLTVYPTEFLAMTQSRVALKSLITRMKPETQKKARQAAAESYGIMTVNGELKMEYNFAAQQYYMALIIELLELLAKQNR